jgi:CRP-like cAMP-binding protein
MTDDPRDPRLRKQLAGHPFMHGLPADDLDVFAELGTFTEFDVRAIIFEGAGRADRFYLIRSGVVSLSVDGDGSYPRTIELISEGSALGWSWLFPPYQWQFDAVAQTPVRAVGFDAHELRARFEADPAFGYRVMLRIAEVMAQRLHATRLQVLNLSK